MSVCTWNDIHLGNFSARNKMKVGMGELYIQKSGILGLSANYLFGEVAEKIPGILLEMH